MKSRALLFLAALLTAPAWSQQPSFDLESDTVRRVVRDTAATQFRAVDPVQDVKPAREPYTRIVFQSPKDAARDKPPAPPPPPPKPVSPLLSAIVDSVLGQEPGFAEAARDTYLQLCQALDPTKPSIQRTAHCP